MNQNNSEFENALNIHLLSFKLPEDIIKENEKIRVSVTTIPEGIKQNFSLEKKEMDSFSYTFSVSATNKTKKIILVFRKQRNKENSYYPIIASSSIHINEFQNVPQKQIISGMMNTDIKNIKIYYPFQQQIKQMKKHSQKIEKPINRKVLGEMQVQLSFIAQYKYIEKISHENGDFYGNKNNDKIPMKKINGKGPEFEKLIQDSNFSNPYYL